MKKLLLILVLAVMGGNVATAGDFDAAAKAYQKRDYVTAITLFFSLADKGHATAQFNLALMYEGGKWVKQDYILAHMWYNLAAKNGDKFGTLSRDIVANQMTPAQISEAQKLAKECEKKNYKNCD